MTTFLPTNKVLVDEDVLLRVNQLESLIKSKKDLAYNLVLRGRLYLLWNKPHKALSDFEQCLEITNNSNPVAMYYLGIIHSKYGQHKEAEKFYTEAINHDHNRTIHTNTLLDNFTNKISALLYRQNTAFEKAFQEIMHSEPSILDFYHKRALIHMYYYDYESGINDFNTIMELASGPVIDDDEQDGIVHINVSYQTGQHPYMHEYKFHFGVAFFLLNQPNDALELFNEAIESASPNVPFIYYVYRAGCHDRLFDADMALRDRRIARKLAPKYNVNPFLIRLLPDDLVINIISYLDLTSMRNIACSCRQMQESVNKFQFNKLLYLPEQKILQKLDKILDSEQFITMNFDQIKTFLNKYCVNQKGASNDKKLVTLKWMSYDQDHRLLLCIDHKLLDPSDRVGNASLVINSMILKWVYEQKLQVFALLYDGDVDGFDAEDFHNKCDGKGPTLTIITSNYGTEIGGYTSVSWSSDVKKNVCDPHAWIFTTHKKRIVHVSDANKAVTHSPSLGPCFGDAILNKDDCEICRSYILFY
jgi:tetratricopeptide (TPR) repeat protein